MKTKLVRNWNKHTLICCVWLCTCALLSCDKDNDSSTNENDVQIRAIKVGDDVTFNMILVDGGAFQMGATKEQTTSGNVIIDDEFPVHTVTVSSFYLAEFEVTNELYAAVTGEASASSLYHPCSGTWDFFDEFIKKLNKKVGLSFRFPTEAEWEYAARGGNKSKGLIYPGSDRNTQVAWCYCNSGEGWLLEANWDWWTMKNNKCSTHVVGTRYANELGLYDMGGNLYEWCSDWYGPYSKEPQTDPKGPEKGTLKACRGGSYAHFSNAARNSHRLGSPKSEYIYWGLRLALDR